MFIFAVVILIFSIQITFAVSDYEVLRKITCENTDLILECQPNYLLKIYLASYGKTHNDYCHVEGSRLIKRCVGNRLRTCNLIHHSCERRRSCRVPVNSTLFGNPCPNVNKYLEVFYDCVEASVLTKLACQRHPLNLKCPGNGTLWITNAFFGRNDPDKCRIKGKSSDQILTYECPSPPQITQIVGKKCNGYNECNFLAEASNLENPCPGTYKYLEVDYQCITGDRSTMPQEERHPCGI